MAGLSGDILITAANLLISLLLSEKEIEETNLFERLKSIVLNLKKQGERVDVTFTGPYNGMINSTEIACEINYWISNGFLSSKEGSIIYCLTDDGKKLLNVDQINKNLNPDTKNKLLDLI